jgi:drug/metabolite transporter (DMT)-like permease
MRQTATPKMTEYALLVVLASLWAASYTFIKMGVETIPPLTLMAGRTLIAGLLLLVVLRLRGIPFPTDIRTSGQMLVQAVVNTVLPFTFIAWSETSIDAGVAVVLNATTPLFAFMIGAVALQREPVTPRKSFGVILGIIGVAIIVGPNALSRLGADVVPQLVVVAASVCFACGAIYGKNFSKMDPMIPAAGSMLLGGVLLVPPALLVDRPWTLSPSQSSLVALVLLAVFTTALAFSIFFRLVRTLGSIAVTAQAYLRAPIGVLIGAALLHERVGWNVWAGLAVVLVSVTLVSVNATLRAAPAPTPAPAPAAAVKRVAR